MLKETAGEGLVQTCNTTNLIKNSISKGPSKLVNQTSQQQSDNYKYAYYKLSPDFGVNNSCIHLTVTNDNYFVKKEKDTILALFTLVFWIKPRKKLRQ